VHDPFHLQRFIDAQHGVIERAMDELRKGRKQSHWIWFIFPQIAGLGSSAMSRRFAIASLAEANAYAAHPVLGPRLRSCTELVNDSPYPSISDVLGFPDDRKFHSSMTLFVQATDDNRVFKAALGKYFGAQLDRNTTDRLPARA
jgi:uncharacterized protein (DUF1810 family)